MKMGILEAETLPAKIVSQFGSYGDMVERLFCSLDTTLQFRRYAVDQSQLPAAIDDCDAYLVTGSRLSAYDHESWILDLQSFIRLIHRRRKKCVGICFGHQLIAHTLGGRTQRSEKGWGVGVATFSIKHHPTWLEPTRQDFSLLVSHQDQVMALPQEAVLIAGNDFCPNGVFQIADHIVCLQGHPEFSREYIRYLLEKRRSIIGEQRVEQALASLQLPTDELAIAAGIYRFLTW